MNKLLVTLSLIFTLFLTGCGLISPEKKIYLSEEKIQVLSSLETKQEIIEKLGKPSTEITNPEKLTKRITASKSLLTDQKKEALNSSDPTAIENLEEVIANADLLLGRLSNHEKVECLIYYWKTNSGDKMEKDVYIYDNSLQFTISQ